MARVATLMWVTGDVPQQGVSLEELTIAVWFKADDFAIHDARLISKAVTVIFDTQLVYGKLQYQLLEVPD